MGRMRRWVWVFAGILGVSAAALPPTRSQDLPAKPPPGDERLADEVVELTNAARKREGLAPLRCQELLTRAAQSHARDMAKRGFFSHTNPEGKQPWDRVKEQGYSYRSCGENIAWGQRSPQQVVHTWLNSPGHRKNILGEFTDIGVGFARSAGKLPRNYWVQVFGTPAR